ncbi:MAG: 30S ribosomal protein S1 [Bacteroidales bacterium]|nr:30S ribosomal protein S1 [Bacteroidales bacterium]
MDYKNVTPLEDFDWSAIDSKEEKTNKEELDAQNAAYDKTFNHLNEQELVEGTIVSVSPREAVVNIGYKSDGVIPASELRYNPDFKAGDKIEVYVESQEDSNGQLILSHKKARVLKSWERVNMAFENGEIINGYVKDMTKGGLIVTLFDNIEAFLPGSQIDIKPIRDYHIFVGKTMEFKVVKITHEYKNVVVSHKALIEDEIEAQKAEIISHLEKGQVLEGTVKNITPYGVFVDLGGVDGLIHITDLSWGRVSHPEEVVQLDQKINVVILDFDEEKRRIALGLKQLTPHPWDAVEGSLKEGDHVKGKVVVVVDYGAFVEVMPGVEGLIHVSEMSWSQHLRSAQDFLKVGDEVECVILNMDRENRKMSLGVKQLVPDPWTNILEKYPIGSKHTAMVRNFTSFGIFVELEEGVDGLIHISDLSWSRKIKHPAEFTKIGEKMEVVVLEVDAENRRISLGHKQLEENPWDVYETVFAIGSLHKGKVISADDKGAVVTLEYDVEGFCPSRHMLKEDKSRLKAGDEVDFKVIEFSKDARRIVLSHTRTYQSSDTRHEGSAEGEEKRERRGGIHSNDQKTVKKISENLEKTTMGDIFSGLKEKLEEIEKDSNNEAK